MARTLLAVTVEVQPPQLAELLDFAERPRAGDWSLRSALVRYAQPQPARASTIVNLVRRLEFGLKPHIKAIERSGPDVWREIEAGAGKGGAGKSGDSEAVALLRVIADLDRLGDVLARWAVDRAGERPDAEVDAVTERVARRVEELGLPEEERPRPPRGRGERTN